MVNDIIKICVMIDILPNSGGGFHMAKSICENIKNIKSNEIKFDFLTTYPETKKLLESELQLKIELYNKSNLKNKIFSKLYKINFFRKLIRLSPMEKYLIKNSYNSIYFISPSYLILQCRRFSSIYTIWETQFNNLKDFPEYKNNIINLRNDCLNHAGKYAKKIFVSTRKLADEIQKNYNINDEKIIYQTFPPFITLKKLKKNYEPNSLSIKKIKSEKYLFYPAQYWKHKNHEYIIQATKLLNKNDIDFKIIFSGYDKGYLDYLKSLTRKLDLENYFIFLDYVTDDDLIFLYRNCYALIIPSLVGTHTFPLYEGFYFKKPLIYNYKNLDSKFAESIIKLDVDNLNSFQECLKELNNKKVINQMLDDNFILYEENFMNIKTLNKLFLKMKI